MHNLYAIFVRILERTKQMAGNLVNEKENVTRRGAVPRFSDLEIISLNLTAESIGIDRENYLFSKLEEYKSYIPNLISRRQFNDRRKQTIGLLSKVREKMVSLKQLRIWDTVLHKTTAIMDINCTLSVD